MKATTMQKKNAKATTPKSKISKSEQEAKELELLKKRLAIIEKERADVEKKTAALLVKEKQDEENRRISIIYMKNDIEKKLSKNNVYKDLKNRFEGICVGTMNILIPIEVQFDPRHLDIDFDLNCDDDFIDIDSFICGSPVVQNFKKKAEKELKAWKAEAEPFIKNVVTAALEERGLSKSITKQKFNEIFEDMMYIMFYREY